MNPITFPLKRQMRGPQVADLQDALKLLLERGRLFAVEEGVRRELLQALQRERRKESYGDAAHGLLARYQEAPRLQPPRAMDEGLMWSETIRALIRPILGLIRKKFVC